jgi:hypothetical protein
MLKSRKKTGTKRGGMLVLTAVLSLALMVPSAALAQSEAALGNPGGGGTNIPHSKFLRATTQTIV